MNSVPFAMSPLSVFRLAVVTALFAMACGMPDSFEVLADAVRLFLEN
jgi:hypothetical protein